MNWYKKSAINQPGKKDGTGPYDSTATKKEKGCRECGNLAIFDDGLCQKCWEENERRRERYKDQKYNVLLRINF